MNYTGYEGEVRVHFCGSKFITLSFPRAGTGSVRISGTEGELGPRYGLLTPAETSFAVELSADYEHLVLRLDPQALSSKLAAMIGCPVDGPLAFEPLFDYSHGDARLLRDHFFTLVDIVSAPAARLPKLVQAEFEQAIMVMFLRASRHNYSHRLEGGGPDAGLAAVRRAEDHIEANWQQPITLEDLAAVSGVSAFSLFRSFKRYRGRTPMQFAEQVRGRGLRSL